MHSLIRSSLAASILMMSKVFQFFEFVIINKLI
jgi:hypothetical protein